MTQAHEIDKLSVIGIFTLTFPIHSCLANKVLRQTKKAKYLNKIYAHVSNNDPPLYQLEVGL